MVLAVLQKHNVYTKFHETWSSGSKIERGCIPTDSMAISKASVFRFRKESNLKMKSESNLKIGNNL